MKIGLIYNDMCTRKTHNFPNLALMKLSAYHKSIGNEVQLINFDMINDDYAGLIGTPNDNYLFGI